jgi:hypothetical protein
MDSLGLCSTFAGPFYRTEDGESKAEFVCMDSMVGWAPGPYLSAIYDLNRLCSMMGIGCTGSGTTSPPAQSESAEWLLEFGRSFVEDFTLRGARNEGETLVQCIDRAQNALLGDTGAAALHAVSGTALITVASTAPIGTAMSYTRESFKLREMVRIPGRSVAEIVTGYGVGAGVLPSNASAVVRSAVPTISKASGLATAVGIGLEAGFVAACR